MAQTPVQRSVWVNQPRDGFTEAMRQLVKAREPRCYTPKKYELTQKAKRHAPTVTDAGR